MSWIQFKVNSDPKPSNTEITIGDSRLTFGVSACRLLKNPFEFSYVEFFRDSQNDQVIGVRFTEKKTEQSVPLIYNRSELVRKENAIISLSVSGKEVLQKVFGEIATGNRSYKCKVSASADIENMLEIDLGTKRIAKPALA